MVPHCWHAYRACDRAIGYPEVGVQPVRVIPRGFPS